ncbi:hypothetical protein [Pseudorhodoferax sp. Leaf265]|uniref:hypothetical protein n=1 Tax=Pseudorhodoferax sp. Leaf265 TaxID=1736315 RepID=UPI0006F21E90|nr:hypothetical protein [Pseudorhodoferax sp. Leaf265]KQP02078.1 hypothetical protein ASF45_18490 [Pseudorhodoferax sp. Leaf265]
MSQRLRLLQRRPLWWLGLLLGVWLSAQTLALAHREVHGSAADHFHVGHAAVDCQLYDHAGAADLLASLPVLALPAVAALAPLARPCPALWAPAPPPFQARGPPALR